MRIRLLLLPVVILSLTACVVVPNYVNPSVSDSEDRKNRYECAAETAHISGPYYRNALYKKCMEARGYREAGTQGIQCQVMGKCD